MSLHADLRLPIGVHPIRYAIHLDIDLVEWRFGGHERIDLVLDAPRREIVIHAADLQLGRVTAVGPDRSVQAAEVSFEVDAEAAVLRFPDALPAGPITLQAEFAGAIRSDLKALYRSTRGEERYVVALLFPAEARRVFPCFDEPTFKARFAIELTAPADLTAVANTRLLEKRRLDDERALWRFAETPPLSTYLLMVAIGPFDGTTVVATNTGLPVRVWLPRGLANDGDYARDVHRSAVEWLETYTGIPYPYDKVEGLALPDFPAGAMENPGAITYRLELLATDPRKTSIAALKQCVETVAHELTHMWWGDLVTLAWWDDIWLNESFATFVGDKAVDALHPEWRIWRDFVAEAGRGFALDALVSTHAIHSDAATAGEALQRFDAISYQKGAAVLRMLETYLGPEVFRSGVRLYLERFRESNAGAADFWRALDDASGQDVTRVAGTWIAEPGHPLVELRLAGETRIALRQTRFHLDPDVPRSPQLWPVPLVVRTKAGETRVLLDDEEGQIEVAAGTWLHPNAGGAGFYRFALDARLRARLLDGLPQLEPTERLVLVDNEWALVRAGARVLGDHIALLRALTREHDRAVLAAVLEQLRWLAAHVVRRPRANAPGAVAAALFEPHLARLGWDAGPSDSVDDRELRPLALRALGEIAELPQVRDEAGRRANARLDGGPMDPDLVGACLSIAAVAGDAALHRRYMTRFREVAGRDPQEEHRLLAALTMFRDTAATDANIAALLDGTVRDQDLPRVFFGAFRNVAAREAYWHAFRAHYPDRIAPLEGLVRHSALSALAQLTPPALSAEVDAFLAERHETDSAEIVARTRESLRLESRAARRIERELDGGDA